MRAYTTATIAILAVGLWAGSAVGVAAQDEETASPMASGAPASPIVATAAPTADPTLSPFVGTVPPNGAYSAEITSEDLLARGASPEFAEQNQGTWTWTFTDGTFALLQSPYIEG